ncbi:MAG: phosphoribosylaminoimidazolesuccinocarboxamide synthase [Actinobacteria bacterium]|nr:phosphoribosylaminoimidazolesuccinocarboxamide synthase [Actinomycetota bacterium]
MTDLKLIHRGKVREMYYVDEKHLLMVATDQISAFDVVFKELVPDKGRVLTAMTMWWGQYMSDVAKTHLVSADPSDFPTEAQRGEWAGRAVLIRKAEMLPLECIVRGYITGSAWKEYTEVGTMHGAALRVGLLEAEELDEPVFTPSTKASEGHDVNISYEEAVELVGKDLAEKAQKISIEAYKKAAAHAAEKGVIIADTKFELGIVDDELVIADELLTPDSSRFWPAENWAPGATPMSLDKQPVRDATEATGWNKNPPAPPLSDETINETRERYITAYERITGKMFSDWMGLV